MMLVLLPSGLTINMDNVTTVWPIAETGEVIVAFVGEDGTSEAGPLTLSERDAEALLNYIERFAFF